MRILKLLVYSMLLVVAACSSDSKNELSTPESIDTQDESAQMNVNGDNEDLASDIDETAVLDPAFDISESSFELIRDLAGYKPDQLAGVVPDLAGIVTETVIGSPEVLDRGEFVTSDVRFGNVVTETDRTIYQCSGGGTLVHEAGTLQLDDTGYSHIRDINNYEFDQCMFEVTTDRVAGGSYSATGVLSTSDSTRSGSGFSEGAGTIEWTAFDLTGPDSLRYEVEGSSTWDAVGSAGNSGDSRQADFNYYRKTRGTEVINEMASSRFQMDLSYHPANLVNVLDMQFSGKFEDSRGVGRVITVNTDSPMSFSAGTDEGQLTQEGQISVQSSDGESMTLIASGANDRLDPSKSPLVDWTSTSADGSTASDTGVSLGSYSVYMTRCVLTSSEGPHICEDGNYTYLLP